MELEKPNLITPYQGLTFLAGLAAERQRQEEFKGRAAMALQRMQQQSELQQERLKTTLEIADWKHQKDMDYLHAREQHWQDYKELGNEGNRIRDEANNIRTQALGNKLADQTAKNNKLRYDMLNNERTRYVGPRGTFLPQDALENPDLQPDDDPYSYGWHTDKNKPGKRYWNNVFIDKATGNPVLDPKTGKAVVDPITINESDFQRMSKNFQEVKDAETSRIPQDVANPPNPNARANQIKSDFQAGRITKDQAVSQLRDLGFQ